MNKKHSLGISILFGLGLLLAACGELSVGLVTPVEPAAGETVTEVPTTPETEPESTEAPVATGEPAEESLSPIPDIVYIGTEGDLWLLESGSDAPTRLTTDANPIGGEGIAVDYSFPRLSGDGMLLAYRKDVSTPIESGYDFTSALWIRTMATGEETMVFDDLVVGFSWKPGTHLLAYGRSLPIEYFLNRAEPDPAFASGISGYDADAGSTVELVGPQRGLALVNPLWSPDGRFLAFAEVIGMEGAGLFAYYDFITGSYTSWEDSIGPFSWSPNGGLVAHAGQVYVATGEERLYLGSTADHAQPIGPDYDGPAYATAPAFSPTGDRIAYLAFLEGPDTSTATLMVLDVATGETTAYGQFDGPWELYWTPNGSHLVFHAGPYDDREILSVDLSDGSIVTLAAGSQPALPGR